METLFVIAALLCVGVSVGTLLRSIRLCDQAAELVTRAERNAGKFNSMCGRVIAAEGALESLTTQHRKLAGKFYATQNSDTPPPADVGRAPAAVRSPAPYCDNWHAGQLAGPMSVAANCDCDYCSEMRRRRSAMKAELLPAAREATLASPRKRE